jgi:hypothetical protein
VSFQSAPAIVNLRLSSGSSSIIARKVGAASTSRNADHPRLYERAVGRGYAGSLPRAGQLFRSKVVEKSDIQFAMG